jgi:hypothetical protein
MSTSSSDQPHFAYLLLSHNNPRQVEALARRILDLSPHAQIVVHHDSRAADPPWGGRPSAPIHLVERGRVSWGDWSMIEATLRMLRYAVDQLDADWFVLVSGEHRPAVDLGQWEMTAAESGNDALLGAVRLPAHLRFGTSDFELNQYLARSRHRWRIVSRPRRNAVHRAMGLVMKISTRIRPIISVEYIHRRDAWAVGWWRGSRPVRGWPFYRGSQWFALNRRAAKAALAIDPAIAHWFEQSWIPDEAYLQTALRRVPGLTIADELTTFVLDTPAEPYPGWRQLSPQDVPAVLASGLPFARKVDLAARPEVVASIDAAADGQRASGQNHTTAPTSRAPQHQRGERT